MANILKKKVNQALVYLRATEAVSRPIAFLMALFVLFFFISTAFGIFLLGRWGYRQIVDVNQSENVTAPAETKPNTTTKEPENSSKQEGSTEAPVQNTTAVAPASTNLPNTGASPLVYMTIAVLGAISHQYLTRSNIKNIS